MSKSKTLEPIALFNPCNHNHIQNKPIRKCYCPPLITCLDIEGIKGGQGSHVLEATGGLMAS